MDSDGYIDIQMDYGFRWITYYLSINIYIYINVCVIDISQRPNIILSISSLHPLLHWHLRVPLKLEKAIKAHGTRLRFLSHKDGWVMLGFFADQDDFLLG